MDSLHDDLTRWSEANVRLHEFICDCANMPLVKSLLTKTLDHWKRLRQVYLHDVFAQRVQEAQKEHWQMLRAMRACDTERLERIVRNHNRAAHAAYATHLKKTMSKNHN
jgi:DNA-binding GntR family transcriptional regulator